MPELPEVETVARALSKRLIGKTIAKVDVLREKNVDTPPSLFRSILPGKRFESISRRGKYLLFHLSGGWVILSHLRMEGKYFFRPDESQIQRHDLIVFHLEGGEVLCYNDSRRFGRMGLYKENELPHTSLSKLGKEPFEEGAEEFFLSLKGKKKPIKEVLLDQTIVAGVGNIYADESLFRSRINPFLPAGSLSREEASSLLSSIQAVLTEAIRKGGSTVKSYHPQEGVDGRMQNELLAYGRGGRPCPRCGFPLHKAKLGGRGTVYCPHCQQNPEEKFVIGVLGPIHSGKSTFASILEKKGFRIFDADQEVRSLYRLPSVKKKLSSAFGEGILKEGGVDFASLRSLLSNSKESRKTVNGIVFPLIKKRAEAYIEKQKPGSRILLDVPLLFDAKMDSLCLATVLIVAPLEKRKQRLLEEGRDADALLSLNADYPLEEAKKKASFVLENEGSVEEFERAIEKLPLF